MRSPASLVKYIIPMIAAVLMVAAVTNTRADTIDLTARAVPLAAEGPARTHAGKLRYRGGVELLSPSDVFGGLSALGVSEDRKRLVALTDRGHRFDARIIYDGQGNLRGLADTQVFSLTDPSGVALIDRRSGDAEAMAPGTKGEMIVAFEQVHRLWVYVPGDNTAKELPAPRELDTAPVNNGIEALTLLKDGRLFALSEGLGRNNVILGWVSDKNGWNVLTYTVEDGYLPTGAATLPSGDVVIVERFFTPRENVRARVRRIEAADIKPGAALSGELLGDLRDPLNVDNFEGIEARTGPKGETLIYLITDDNFKRRDPQRTLLMMFELDESRN